MAQRALPTPAARRAIRMGAGLTQPDLAAELGVSPATISRWEAGLVVPLHDHRQAYAQVLDDLRALA